VGCGALLAAAIVALAKFLADLALGAAAHCIVDRLRLAAAADETLRDECGAAVVVCDALDLDPSGLEVFGGNGEQALKAQATRRRNALPPATHAA
jgi:hypothetical protein